jgi:hypothetical protein
MLEKFYVFCVDLFDSRLRHSEGKYIYPSLHTLIRFGRRRLEPAILSANRLFTFSIDLKRSNRALQPVLCDDGIESGVVAVGMGNDV